MAPAAIRCSMHPGFRMEAAHVRNLAEWIAWITEPKKPETRVKRLDRAAERLGKGQKSIY